MDFCCGGCGTRRRLTEEEESEIAYWETLAQSSEQWQCKTCLQVNAKPNLQCQSCNEPKIEDVNWSCNSCTFDNMESDTQCFVCNADSEALASGSKRGGGMAPGGCGLPGCPLPVTYFGFCGAAHRDVAATRRILPREENVQVNFVGVDGDYTLKLLGPKHARALSVKQQFLQSWKNETTDGVPRVERVYWVIVKPHILEAWRDKCQTLGNTQRRFHGYK